MTAEQTGRDAGAELATVPRMEVLDISADGARTGLAAIRRFQAVVREVLVAGVDYGTIPGCGDKPTLLKPGAEKVAKLLKCYDHYEFVEKLEDWDKPLFHYLVRCTLMDMPTETRVSSGMGEANSYESKHRYRWTPEDQVPAGVDKSTLKKRGGKRTLFEFEFALKKRETAGQYGKPESYWADFDRAIQGKVARQVMKKTKKGDEYPGWEYDTDTTLYQMPNPDIFDQVNTLVKMAKKRALVDATLSAGRLSELFTQDLEDLHDEPPMAPPPEAKPTAKTLPRVRDGMDPDAPAPDETSTERAEAEEDPLAQAHHGPVPGGPPSMAALEKFAKVKAGLMAPPLSVSEMSIWDSIQKFCQTTLRVAKADLNEFTTSELELITAHLHRRKKASEADLAKKEVTK